MANAQDYLVIKNGKRIAIGDRVQDSRGAWVILSGFQPPRHEGSTGRVDIRTEDGKTYIGEFYPSVIGAAIILKAHHDDPDFQTPVTSLKHINKYLATFSKWQAVRDSSGYYYFVHPKFQPSSGVYVYTWRGTTLGFWKRAIEEYLSSDYAHGATL